MSEDVKKGMENGGGPVGTDLAHFYEVIKGSLEISLKDDVVEEPPHETSVVIIDGKKYTRGYWLFPDYQVILQLERCADGRYRMHHGQVLHDIESCKAIVKLLMPQC